MTAHDSFNRLYDIIVRLRAPDGCPWDREQTPSSMRRHLLEETYESIEAIENEVHDEVREELGDLFMLVTMIARMYEEDGLFTVSDVLDEVSEKLVRRHPHVFGDVTVDGSDEVVDQWQRIKTEQEGKRAKTGVLDKVSQALPSLERAYKLQRAAAKVGFDWPTLAGVREKLVEEIDEVIEAAGGADSLAGSRRRDDVASAELECEVGDLLFSAVNVARYLGVDPSIALNRANLKFVSRFRSVETEMTRRGLDMSQETLATMDEIWTQAKSERM